MGEEKLDEREVHLNIYDLSNGLAKQVSMALLGTQLDGVWHTGIVIRGKEYYFGSGICHDVPGKTPFGKPVKTVFLGHSDKTQKEVVEILKVLRPKFSETSYDLFKNNCNHFTEAVSQALLGKSIPEEISSLPSDFMNSPLGASLLPIV